MITIIYRIIVVIVAILVIWNMFTEKKFINQLNAAMVIIPLVLRALMIK